MPQSPLVDTYNLQAQLHVWQRTGVLSQFCRTSSHTRKSITDVLVPDVTHRYVFPIQDDDSMFPLGTIVAQSNNQDLEYTYVKEHDRLYAVRGATTSSRPFERLRVVVRAALCGNATVVLCSHI